MKQALVVHDRPDRSRGAAGRRIGRDLILYAFVSLAALACDYGLLLGLVGQGVHYLVAQALSFSLGIAVAYALSARFVFADRRRQSRAHEALGFVAVGLAGLVLSQVLLSFFVAALGLSVAAAKLPTAGAVFVFNFLARRGLVFAGRLEQLE